MQDFPHVYVVRASAAVEGEVALESTGIPRLIAAPPAEFGGPGNQWSPETLLVAAVSNCFVLSFRAIARASEVSWQALHCEAEGTLERVDRVTQFTRFVVRARLHVPADTDEEKARRVLARAEQSCLITNSLKAPSHLEASIEVEAT